jgi:hypothetical protein
VVAAGVPAARDLPHRVIQMSAPNERTLEYPRRSRILPGLASKARQAGAKQPPPQSRSVFYVTNRFLSP